MDLRHYQQTLASRRCLLRVKLGRHECRIPTSALTPPAVEVQRQQRSSAWAMSGSSEPPHQSPQTEQNSRRGALGAGSLCVHSFLDGFSIGLAFKVSTTVGAFVASAVLVHDFSDGVNTVSLILKNRGGDRSAFRWLVIDAVAPIIGAASTMVFTLQEAMLGLGLAAMAGFFLYIGASDLLPESYHDHPTLWTTAMTILGALTMFVAIRLANG